MKLLIVILMLLLLKGCGYLQSKMLFDEAEYQVPDTVEVDPWIP